MKFLLDMPVSPLPFHITADLDFPRLLALSLAEGPGLVLFRGGNYSDSELCDLLERLLKTV